MTPETRTAPKSPRDEYEHWQEQIAIAQKELREWHEEGKALAHRFKADKKAAESHPGAKLNIFTTNVQTQHALLFGRIPKVSVDRTNADAKDDVARVAGAMLERLLNLETEKSGDTYVSALSNCLLDRLLPGLGVARIRYEVEWRDVAAKPPMLAPDGRELAPGIPAGREKAYECAAVDWVYWEDFLWSPARTWEGGVTWVAFGADMSLEQLTRRFGHEIAARVPLNSPTPREKEESGKTDPLARARVWEIWDKPSKRVHWYCEGMGALLETKEDPYHLTRFFPCPTPLLATMATDKALPTPDFRLAKHQYEEVDLLTQRILLLEEAVRVAGVYDGKNEQIQRIVNDKGFNRLYPVDNWAALAERGGLRGSVDWLPLDQIVNALAVLVQQRTEAKQQLFEVTGLSDIMRGQGEGPGVTLGEQEIKAQFASIRLQKLQEDFARFAGELQAIRAEVIARHFDVGTILTQANAEHMEEAPELVQQAAAMLKSGIAQYRVKVKPEAISAHALARLQHEREAVVKQVIEFLQVVAPLAQALPGSTPFLMRMLKALVATRPGAGELEGILDDAVAAFERQAPQPPQQPQPDMSKVQAAMVKAQADIAKVEKEGEVRMAEIAAEVQADRQREENQMRFNVAEHAAKQQITNALRPPQLPGSKGPRGAP